MLKQLWICEYECRSTVFNNPIAWFKQDLTAIHNRATFHFKFFMVVFFYRQKKSNFINKVRISLLNNWKSAILFLYRNEIMLSNKIRKSDGNQKCWLWCSRKSFLLMRTLWTKQTTTFTTLEFVGINAHSSNKLVDIIVAQKPKSSTVNCNYPALKKGSIC